MGIIVYMIHKKKDGDGMNEILRKMQGKTPEELLSKIDITKPPIDIKKLVEVLSISVKKKDFSDIENQAHAEEDTILGAAISRENSLTIFYSAKATYNRMRFTVAHEIAHCCLHSDNLEMQHVELRTAFGSMPSEHEKEADIFAGELLIPKKLLDIEYKKFIVPSLKTLADLFQVSVNVMAARLDYLGYSYLKDAQLEREGL